MQKKVLILVQLIAPFIGAPALTNAAGFYSIKSLPIGSWTIHAWSETGTDSKQVTVTGDNAIEVNFVLE